MSRMIAWLFEQAFHKPGAVEATEGATNDKNRAMLESLFGHLVKLARVFSGPMVKGWRLIVTRDAMLLQILTQFNAFLRLR